MGQIRVQRWSQRPSLQQAGLEARGQDRRGPLGVHISLPDPPGTNAPLPRKQWPGSGGPRVTYHSSLPRTVTVLALKVPHPKQRRAVDYPKWSPNFLRTPPPVPPEPALTRGFPAQRLPALQGWSRWAAGTGCSGLGKSSAPSAAHHGL